MPQTRQATTTGLPPVPVAVLLPPPHRPPAPIPGEVADWCGIQPRDAATLIARYTRRGDVVLNLDPHPMITRAVQYLGRHPATLPIDGNLRLGSRRTVRRLIRRPGAGLILAVLPRADADSADLPSVTAAMLVWRTWLRPGGYLLTALTAPSRETRQVSHRATVIAAGRTAGLLWHQELLVLRQPLPEHEPRAMPDTAATTHSALIDGRHEQAHVKLLAFRNAAGRSHA